MTIDTTNWEAIWGQRSKTQGHWRQKCKSDAYFRPSVCLNWEDVESSGFVAW